MTPFTLKQLVTFEAVMRLRHFTRAAEELNLSQPAVSMQVKQLEYLVRAPLLERHGRALAATEAGQVVLEHARAVIDEIAALSTALDGIKGLKTGKLRISTVTTVNYFMPTLLRTFCGQHPGINVIVSVGNRQELLGQLQDNETDIAVMGQPPENLNLEAAAFLDNPLVIVAPADHPLAGRNNIPVKRLADEAFLMREQGSGTRSAMERFFSELGIGITTSVEVSGAEALKQGVQAGLGLALMSHDAVELELTLGRLAVLDVAGLPIDRHWYIVHRAKRRLGAPALAFKKFITGEASRLLDRPHGRHLR